MPIITRFGGGGGGLNFKVVQYTATPTGTAAENTIGVVTSTAISGWVMQAEQPTAVAGLVWIETAAASEVPFYADKKQTVKLYPKAVKQYVSGAWANKEAYVYQNGWVQFSSVSLYLYANGDLYESVTGGWSTNNGTFGKITFEPAYIDLTNGNPYGTNWVYTTNKIDITNYKTLKVNLTCRNGSNKLTGKFGIGTSTTAFTSNGTYTAGTAAEETNDWTFDVSDSNGEYYILVNSDFNSQEAATNYVHINSVELIP
jgi:hypothetical protein